MSTMNISSQNIVGSCSLKCNLSYNYNDSNGVTATNKGHSIEIVTHSNSTNPPVLYNNIKYILQHAQIYYPSSFLYNGSKASAEILLEHTPVAGGNMLFISIPINTTGASTKGTTILTNIIDAISAGANAPGQNTNKIPDFNYNDIVPMKPFYTFTDTGNNNWICYGIKDAITIGSGELQILQKCTKPTADARSPTPSLFLNSQGPSSNTGAGGDIYIDCQPTGNSEEETNVTLNKTPSITSGVSSDMLMFALIFIVSTIVFFIVIMGSNKLLVMVTGE
jgi:hypothetical protein